MQIRIDVEVCKGCGLCVYFCPRTVLRMNSQRHNKKGYVLPEIINREACTSCRLCEAGCPDLAIYIEKPPIID
jgi:2-oxoglutarate ferredoxin oxidoreductase subunit delta